MFRLLHLADVHLDTAFSCREPSARRLLRSALRSAFKRAVDVALEESVDAVLIAGDLVDSDQLSYRTERTLVNQFGRLQDASIPVFYASGNHDPGGPHSRIRELTLPPLVQIIDDEQPRVYEIEGKNGGSRLKLAAAGHGNRRQEKNLAIEFPALPEEASVGLLHTWVTSALGSESHDRYAPCSASDLEAKGYSYWALGHLHVRQQVGSLAAWYSGNIQGRTPAEPGEKGGLLVQVPGRGPATVQFVPLSSVRWCDLYLESLAEATTFQHLERSAEEAFASFLKQNGVEADDCFLRFWLEGPCPLADQLRDVDELREAEELIATRLKVPSVTLATRGLVRPIDLEKFEPGPHLLLEIRDLIRRARCEKELRLQLMPFTLAGGPAEEDHVDGYLQELLQDLEAHAAYHMLEGEDAT